MYLLYRRLAVLCLLLAVASLAPAQDEKLQATTPYYPLEVGNTWSYRAGANKFSFRVAKIEKVGSVPCARLELVVKGKPVSFEHIAVTKDAVLRESLDGKQVTPPLKFLELPPKPGATWDISGAKIAGQVLKGSFKLDKEKGKVKVPAGEYDTVTVTGKDLDANGVKLNITYYFAENVGMVKQVMEIAGQKVIIELEKFEPAKAK